MLVAIDSRLLFSAVTITFQSEVYLWIYAFYTESPQLFEVDSRLEDEGIIPPEFGTEQLCSLYITVDFSLICMSKVAVVSECRKFSERVRKTCRGIQRQESASLQG